MINLPRLMGIGIVLAVEPEDADSVTSELSAQGEQVYRIGEVQAASGEKGQVHWA